MLEAGRATTTPAGSACANALAAASTFVPGRSAQVDATQRADALERRLRAGDVHDRDALIDARPEHARDPQRDTVDASLHVDRVAGADTQPLRRGHAEEDHIGLERIERARDRGHEGRLDRERTEDIDPQHAQAFVATGEACIDLDDGARRGDFRPPRELRIEELVEARARAAHLQVGVSCERLHAQRELVHRRAVDELHREAERNAECDRKHGEGGAQPVLREGRSDHRTQRADRGHLNPPARSSSGRRPVRVSSSTRSAVRAAARECVTRMPAASLA